MKKLFIAIAALAAMTSCSQDEVMEVAEKQAISFGNAFVGNSTRAAIDNTYSGNTELTKFNVYGTVTGTGTAYIFKGDEVTGNIGDATWSCNNVQYWIPNSTYKFIAIADATSVPNYQTSMPTTITYTDGTTVANEVQKDLLYAEVTDATNDVATPSKGNPVKFIFDHLLSKAKFTFTHSAYNNANYTYDVTNIRFVDVNKTGTYTIASKAWTSVSNEGELLFGNLENKITKDVLSQQSNYEKVFVPANYTKENPLVAKFTVDTYVGTEKITSRNYIAEIVQNFEKGHAYNFNVALSNTQILFTVTRVNGWDTTTSDISGTPTSVTVTAEPEVETPATPADPAN